VNVKTKKAIMALYEKGHDAKEIVEILSLREYGSNLIDSIIKKELAIEKALEKPKTELTPEPERTVLKWKRFQKIDKRSHPKNHANVLVADCDNNYHTCFFSITSSKIDFLLLNPTSETDEIINKVIYWMYLPSAPKNEGEIDDEYLIEQTTLETFDIIDAITPALREAVKHLLVQQGANK
jgi:hypothetical protein